MSSPRKYGNVGAAGAVSADDVHEEVPFIVWLIRTLWHLIYIMSCPFRWVWHSIDIYIIGCMRAYTAKAFENAWLPLRTVLVAMCLQRLDGKFRDNFFPPEAKSLGALQDIKVDTLEWKHLSDIVGVDPKLISGKIEAADITQGSMGNCWLLAAIASLAEYKGALQNIFVTKQFSPIGKYTVRLYNARLNRWILISVDDFVPVLKGTNTPAFAKPNGSEMWACILEKAFAKYCGSYAALDGGHALWALQALTGDCVMRFSRDVKGGRWQKKRLVHAETGVDTRQVHFDALDEYRDDDEMFEIIRKFDSIKSVMCASSAPGAGNKDIVPGHAYTLVGAHRVRPSIIAKLAAEAGLKNRTETIRLVKLRNPWKTFEWKGDWSDSSPLWTEHPDVAKAVDYKPADDGTFWMSWHDFCERGLFVNVDVCKRSLGVSDLALQINEDDGCLGPTMGCTKGLATYYFCCRGLGAMCNSTKSDDETVETAFCESVLQFTPFKCVLRV